MLLFIVACVALSVTFGFLFVAQMLPNRSSVLAQKLNELHETADHAEDILIRRRRQERSDRFKSILQTWGERLEGRRTDNANIKRFLVQAGYLNPMSVSYYWGTRFVLMAGLGAVALLFLPVTGIGFLTSAFAALWFAILGWIAPTFYVGRRVKKRQKEIVKALPDALDLLVVCVEAGLGLNQAIVRVSEEINHVSQLMSDQLALVNLEIRAGTPRDDALRNLGERTGVPDVVSLVAMLIQTDRFGTSIAQALRVHADTMRTKRRQRAEEAAAKTTIKLVFPLVLFIFPTMFVVILAPALIRIIRTLEKTF
ncbi:MAG: type II secretion system F family protein [Chloroflexi bacterium]|nr:type II secretion system F family protein [Chloroflexota bacterium]